MWRTAVLTYINIITCTVQEQQCPGDGAEWLESSITAKEHCFGVALCLERPFPSLMKHLGTSTVLLFREGSWAAWKGKWA